MLPTMRPSSQGIYKSGKTRYLAVAAPQAHCTNARCTHGRRSGRPRRAGCELLCLPAFTQGLDAATRDKIPSDMVSELDPQVREKLATLAFQPTAWTVPEMQQFAQKKSGQYKLLIEKAQISLV